MDASVPDLIRANDQLRARCADLEGTNALLTAQAAKAESDRQAAEGKAAEADARRLTLQRCVDFYKGDWSTPAIRRDQGKKARRL